MGIVYFIICAIGLSIFFISKSYKKETLKNLSLKENPLKKIYPMTMFIEDKALWRITSFKSDKVDKNLRAILVKEKIQEERYIYKIKKMSICVVVILFFNVIGMFISIGNWADKSNYTQEITRPEYGELSKDYELDVKNASGESETVSLSVDSKKYSQDEIYKLFDENYENVLKEMLNKNVSQDEIKEPLKLISSYSIFNISWKIEDTKIIDFSGNIYNENIDKEGLITYITAIFDLEDTKKEYEIGLRIIPPTLEKDKSLEEKIQESLESLNSIYDAKVKLPTKIDDSKIVFKIPVEKVGFTYLILGLILSVVIFFGFDKDLENKIKKREDQMMLDYSDIVSKLTLLMGAGLNISVAWERIVKDYERKVKPSKKRFAFEEMKLANTKIKSGVSETTAYLEFGKRCGLSCYLKLAGLLEQNLKKGTKELRLLLEGEVREAFNNRKGLAKIKGEEASTKLLFPMIIMLGIVIVIIVVPAFLSMNI